MRICISHADNPAEVQYYSINTQTDQSRYVAASLVCGGNFIPIFCCFFCRSRYLSKTQFTFINYDLKFESWLNFIRSGFQL